MVNYLIIFLFTGRGMMQEGQQVLLMNEFDKKTRFYKIFKAESKLRFLAETYPNSYMIGIFACSRQLYNETKFEGICHSKEEVKVILD